MPGRGRGRGRGGGRGHRRGRVNRNRSQNCANDPGTSQQIECDIENDTKAFFTGVASTEQHLAGQNANRTRYAATFAVLVDSKIQITQNARIRALAMAWAREDRELVATFLGMRSQFGLIEILKALTLLDAGRQIRVLEKRAKCLELSTSKVNPSKLGRLKSDIDNLKKLKPSVGSASGAVCKQVAKWVRGFSYDDILFYAVHFPKEPWKKLADICHLNPEKDFPNASWFLPFCFGTGSPPTTSIVHYGLTMTAENVNEMIMGHNIPFSVIKPFIANLTEESKTRIAEYEVKLDTVLWYYEDLRCTEVDRVLSERLAANHTVNLPNGKLLERLLTILMLRNPELTLRNRNEEVVYNGEPEGEINFFTRLIELAEPRLTSIRLSLESPVVVMGDASSSMDVAIRTSTIIASLLTAICSANLVFFDSVNRAASILPKTVKEMMKLAVTTRAAGATAPAASLYPFYERKEVVKTFIMVTDEEENTPSNSYKFAGLYQKYCEEVYPAHLVFVSFLRGQHAEGQMVKELNAKGYYPKQLRLHGSRPDLTKLDDFFAQLSAVTTVTLQEQLATAEMTIKTSGIGKLYGDLGTTGFSSQEEE